jgi:hypothetical protein
MLAVLVHFQCVSPQAVRSAHRSLGGGYEATRAVSDFSPTRRFSSWAITICLLPPNDTPVFWLRGNKMN